MNGSGTMKTAFAALALAALALAAAPAPRAFAAMPVNGAWQVAAGSIGNLLELELHNLDAAAIQGPLSVRVVDAPPWVTAISIVPPAGAAGLGPTEVATVTVGFNVAGGTSIGTRGEITFLITAAGGDAWTRPVPFEIAERPDEIQTDCCSAVEISTTGVGGAGAMSAGGAATGDVDMTSVPNPSNPATTIRFMLAAPGAVRVTIHDVSGRLVRTLASGPRDAGRHDIAWDGRMERGEPAPSGIYFVRVEAGGTTHSAKLVLTR